MEFWSQGMVNFKTEEAIPMAKGITRNIVRDNLLESI